MINYKEDTGELEIIPTFFKPRGRFDYVCQRCRLSGIFDERVVQNLTYKPNSKAILEVMKEFRKIERDFAKAIEKYEGK